MWAWNCWWFKFFQTYHSLHVKRSNHVYWKLWKQKLEIFHNNSRFLEEYFFFIFNSFFYLTLINSFQSDKTWAYRLIIFCPFRPDSAFFFFFFLFKLWERMTNISWKIFTGKPGKFGGIVFSLYPLLTLGIHSNISIRVQIDWKTKHEQHPGCSL